MREVPLLSIRVRPLSLPELMVLRLLSRLQADADALFRAVVRLRFLRSAIGSGLGWRAARGLATAETCLMLMLAMRPAHSADDVRRKGDLMRQFLAEDPNGNADAMFAAAVEADFDRLGMLVAGHGGDRSDVAAH